MQQLYVHLGRQGGGVKLLDHLNRRAGISGKRQQIDVAAKYQTKSNSGVAQAVKSCGLRRVGLLSNPVNS